MIERMPRRNLFLSATAETGTACAPVRICNLSERGAMIDGSQLPEVGASITLRRLEVSIGATAVWNDGSRCGLRLGGAISIDDWVAGVASSQRTGSLGQSRVDAIQAAIRGGEDLLSGRAVDPPPAVLVEALPLRIAQELDHVKHLLEAVADDLTENLDVLVGHAEALQNFDIATQIIAHLGTILASERPGEVVAGLPMHDLRHRLLGTPTMK